MSNTRTLDALRQYMWHENVVRDGDCLVWQGLTQWGGYGSIRYRNKLWFAHRLSWTLANGDIPTGLIIMHTCDNRRCVSPEHLQLGTQADNVADMERKGRGRKTKGSTHHKAKLTEAQVVALRIEYASGNISQSALAATYGITQAVVSKIVRRVLWPHV